MRRPSLSLRVFLDVALVASVLFLPWLTTLLLALLILFISPGYEVILAGIALDVLYGDRGPLGIGVPLTATIIGFILFVGAHVLKRNFIRQA